MKAAGGKLFLEVLDGLFSLSKGSTSNLDLIPFIRAAKSFENLETETGVGTCHKHELASVHFARLLRPRGLESRVKVA
jgi:hypothetical protein